MIGKAIMLILGVWIFLVVLFHIFGDVILGYPRSQWVGQFIFIGIVLMIAWGIIIAIALLIGKLNRKSRREKIKT